MQLVSDRNKSLFASFKILFYILTFYCWNRKILCVRPNHLIGIIWFLGLPFKYIRAYEVLMKQPLIIIEPDTMLKTRYLPHLCTKVAIFVTTSKYAIMMLCICVSVWFCNQISQCSCMLLLLLLLLYACISFIFMPLVHDDSQCHHLHYHHVANDVLCYCCWCSRFLLILWEVVWQVQLFYVYFTMQLI